MSEQNDPQEQDLQRSEEERTAGEAETPRTEGRTPEKTEEEIDELHANSVDDLQGTNGVTEVTENVNRAEGPVL